jgi:ABC-type glycerol-3-phosphate transport system permease component
MLIMLIPTFQTVQESSQGIMRLPSHFNFNNYIEAWRQSKFHLALRNSIIITGFTLLINILIGSIAAFPMAIREIIEYSRQLSISFSLVLCFLSSDHDSALRPHG